MNTNIDHERFIRWQAITIEERGKSINLFLSLSLATIAFLANQSTNKDFLFKNIEAKLLMGVGALLLVICIVIMIFLNVNRLKDFNQTMNLIKVKMGSASNTDIKTLEKQNISTGKITKKWFNISVSLFGFGEFLVILGLLFQLKEKIF